MKPQLSFAFLLLFFASALTAQVEFKVKLLPDNSTYQVLMRSAVTYGPPLNNMTQGSQVTLRVPTGGFQVGQVTSLAGTWNFNAPMIVAPAPEAPGFDYIVFSLANSTNTITYEEGVEVALFEFANSGSCTGPLELIENEVDPFWPPNSQNANVGNSLVVFGFGPNNAYIGNYNAITPDCSSTVNPDCPGGQITIQDLQLNAPSGCNMADGSIVIEATHATNNNSLRYRIQSNGAFQTSNTFTGLTAGTEFEITVRDNLAFCTLQLGTFELPGPLAGIPDGHELVQPSCGGSDGQITISAILQGDGPLEYGIGTPPVYQASNTFTGLSEDVYSFWVRDVSNGCANFHSNIQLDEDCVEPTCDITYELEKTGANTFQVSMIPNMTYNAPFNITNTLQVTIKTPTADPDPGFVVQNLMNLVPAPPAQNEITWSVASTYPHPTEDENSDYITFALGSPGTQHITYEAGVKLPLFTFENGGDCQSGNVALMDNTTDAFFPPNSEGASVGQLVFVLGAGDNIFPCSLNNPADDCNSDPCSGFSISFTANDGCEGDAIDFTSTVNTSDAITSWEWEFGDTPAGTSSDENPTYTYSNSGNFEVSLTVTTESGCMATVSEFVTVFPSPGGPTVTEYVSCDGLPVTLSAPSADMVEWSPATGLDDANSSNPIATPAQTTTYTVTLTTADGCTSATDVTVIVSEKPIFKDVSPMQASDCGLQDGSIQVSATGIGEVAFSIDGVNFQSDSLFTNLAPGDYTVFLQNADGTCPTAFNGNPVTILDLVEPNIDSVNPTDPTGCDSDGAITVNASAGTGNLMYSIAGPVSAGPQAGDTFNNLPEGTYTVTVTNENGSCSQTQDVTLTGDGNTFNVQTAVPDQDLCVSATANISITLSEDIANYTINSGSFANDNVVGNTLTFEATAAMGANNFNISFESMSSCTTSESFTLTGVAEAAPNFSVPASLCANGNVALNYTGTGNGQIIWDIADGTIENGDLNSDNIVLQFATAGQKQICVTMDDNGCQTTDCQMISLTDFDPNPTFVTTDPACGNSDGAIEMTVAAGLQFSWTGPGAVPTNEDQTALPGGTYFVEISDPNTGCSTTEQVELAASQSVSVLTSSTNDLECGGSTSTGSITAEVAGSSGELMYELFEQGGTTAIQTQNTTATEHTFTNISSGAYMVKVTNLSGGCTDEEAVAVQSTNSTISAISTTEDAECGLDNGSVQVEISGGSGNFTYDFYIDNILQNTDIAVLGNTIDIANVAPATMLLLINDDAGCIVPVTATVGTEPNDLSSIVESVSPATCGGNDGAIALTGVPTDPANVAWSNQNDPFTQIATGFEISGQAAGAYTAQIQMAGGCIEEVSYLIPASNGAEIAIQDEVAASCGSNDGSVSFMVSGGGDFSYEIIGCPSCPAGFGNPGTMVTVEGIPAGTFVVQTQDLSNQSCESVSFFEIAGSVSASTTIIPQSTSECGIADGQVTLEITDGGVGPFTLTASYGNAPSAEFLDGITVTELYIDPVILTLTDVGAGCDTEIEVMMPQVPIAEVNIAAMTDLTCPDDMGSILSLDGELYQVFNSEDSLIAETTATIELPAGIYTVQHHVDLCIDEMEVEITAPAAFSVAEAVSLESCEGLDASISIAVGGANGDYTFDWSNGMTGENISGISSGEYTVTVTDALGCTTTESYLVDTDCQDNCDDIFLIDTFYVELQDDRNEICLPTDFPDITIFDLSLNNEVYNGGIESCEEMSNVYTYAGQFDNFSAPPYRMEEWTYRGQKVTDFEFTKVEDLVDYMNTNDPLGNWVLNPVIGNITGGIPGADYGTIVISHAITAQVIDFNPNIITVNNPSIFVEEALFHIFTAQDPTNSECSDILYINLNTNAPDTIYVNVDVGETTPAVCLPTAYLPGIPEKITNICESAATERKAQLISTGDPCVNFRGLSKGTEVFCMEICDDLGNCTVVPVVVNVNEDDEFEIFNGFSPNNDGRNDFFRIKGIERFPNNELVVFNRWGNRVYTKKGYTNSDPWVAEYKNTYLASGTYFYMLDVEMDGKMETFSGFVEVRR